MKIKPYELTHINGIISIEKELKPGLIKGDIGIQIAEDGRIWLCIHGQAAIRVTPESKLHQYMNTK